MGDFQTMWSCKLYCSCLENVKDSVLVFHVTHPILTSTFFLVGGAEEIDQLPVPQFRRGLVGCISELSVGKLFALDLLHRAQNGQNVDSCRETFDF